MAETFIAWLLNNQDIYQKVPCPDDYAFLHSGCYQRIAGKKKYEQKSADCDLYVSVSYGKRKIYLKYHAGPVNKDEVLMTYSNFARLGTNGREDIPVVIKKSNSFWYSWRNGNSATRLNFRVALFSVAVGLISLIITFFI